MSKPECRESRSVPFDPHGIVWAAAAVEGGVYLLAAYAAQSSARAEEARPPSSAPSPAGDAISTGDDISAGDDISLLLAYVGSVGLEVALA